MRGRCAGCGTEGEVLEVVDHTISCRKFAVLYREHPERALYPGREYQRWRAEDKAGEQTARVEAKVAATDDARARMAGRFRTRDILEDE